MEHHNLSEIFKQILKSQEAGKQDFRWENVQEIAEELGVTKDNWHQMMNAFDKKIQTGHNFLKHDNYQDGMQAFEEANKLCPQHPKALLGLSLSNEMAYYDTKKLRFAQNAIQLAQQVIERTAKNPRAFEIVSGLKKAQEAQLQKRRKFWGTLTLTVVILSAVSFLTWKYSGQVWEKLEPRVTKLTEFFREKEDQTFVLNTIQFELGSIALNEPAKQELNRLIEFLKKHPDIKGEVSGHTDDLGDKIHNMQVSVQRAEAVHSYLRSQGISEGQITYKGYGGEHPKFPNTSEVNRAKNRRIEFKIISSDNK